LDFSVKYIYEGEFFNGLKHGVGRMLFDNGDYYYGGFKDNQKSGIGFLKELEKEVWTISLYENNKEVK
jgi:hypothetical protein